MKKYLLVFTILFLAVSCLFAQSVAPSLKVNFPSVSVSSSTATTTDSIAILADNITQQQYTVDTYKIHSQSDRVTFYGLLRQLAQSKQMYYNLLAQVTPDRAELCRQTAWRFKRDADQFAQRQYACIPSENILPVPVRRLQINQ